MRQVAEGDTVRVHYTGRLKEDGTQFDTSQGGQPLQFTVGEGRLIKGFEEAVLGMSVGERRTIVIPSEEAYGPHREELVLRLKREQFPPSISPEVGMPLQLRQPDGGVIDVLITDMDAETVTLDANHPLAGKDLEFEIELVEIL
jgi:peptidylprolyl isomerase